MKDIVSSLIAAQKEDQESIRLPEFLEVSSKHVVMLKKIIDKIGWPTISKVGEEASKAAWLIVQHADHDTSFQQYCLELMLAVKDDVVKKDIAYLTDRIRVHQNMPQLYGTQFYTDEDGVFGPRPIESPEEIEDRWVEMEMQGDSWKTFAEYKKYMVDKFGS
jgi:hypothetical protein